MRGDDMTAPRIPSVRLLLESAVSLLVAAVTWYFLVREVLIASEAREVMSDAARVAYVGLAMVSTAAIAGGLYASWRSRHGLAAVGFLVGAASPTFFLYIGNLFLVAFAVWELALRLRRVTATPRGG